MKNEIKNKIEYRKVGDYYIPNLAIPKDEYADYHIEKYGYLRLSYLKKIKSRIHNNVSRWNIKKAYC